MVDNASILHDLQTYRPDHVTDFPEHFIWPQYQGLCVGNLGATIASILGASLPNGLPPLSIPAVADMAHGVKQVILLVMDGLGWLQLARYMHHHPDSLYHRIADQGILLPLTSGFLSTTNSVLSMIWTGVPPVQHGLLAYELYLREWMMAVEAISFGTPHIPFSATLADWGFVPESFLPVPSMAQVLSVQGVLTYQLTAKQYVRSHLSRMHNRGVREVHSYNSGSDFWLNLRRMLAHCKQEKALIGGYWSLVDTLAHTYGPLDETGDMEIRALELLLDQVFLTPMPVADREGTLVMIIADHGQITTPEQAAVLLPEHPDLANALMMPPVGEARVPFFYPRSGQFETVWQYLHEHFAGDFFFLTREQVLEYGLLGPGDMFPEVEYRLGDIIGIAKGDKYFLRDTALAKKLRGKHGGMSPEEMLVPLMAFRLDAIK
ncbi:MAG: alkaline phosphatase family protein [Anaerolineae bacterium]|nr:alkaline phosphatase family protein [Anaerolineae bacterium]